MYVDDDGAELTTLGELLVGRLRTYRENIRAGIFPVTGAPVWPGPFDPICRVRQDIDGHELEERP